MEYDLAGMCGLPLVWKQPEWYDNCDQSNSSVFWGLKVNLIVVPGRVS